MKPNFPKTRFEECSSGDYVLSLDELVAFRIVKSGNALPSAAIDVGGWQGGSSNPNSLILSCYWVSSKYSHKVDSKKGDLVIDYFEDDFYGPLEKESIDHFIFNTEKGYKKL
jgi:hypothetical protein